MSDQFIRKASLVVTKAGTNNPLPGLPLQGLDLSELRLKFTVNQADTDTPNIAIIRVYNPSDQTAKTIVHEYDTVVLQAGYESGNFGVIFRGTIKQFRRGRERNVDGYLDILAADGDLGYNYGIINKSMPKETTVKQELEYLSKATGLPLDPTVDNAIGNVVLNPRGKVAFGLSRAYLRDIALTQGCRWSIQNGNIVFVPLTGYLDGEVVKINSTTGMIGVPEATNEGIRAVTLLNPTLKVGNRVQIDNKDISQTIIREQAFPQYRSAPTMIANVTWDGIYRVLSIDHEGDTRGQEWYSTLICLSLDPSAKVASSVRGFGG